MFFGPFVAIWCYCAYWGIRNIKKINESFIILTLGIVAGFALSFLLGKIFFSITAVTLIVVMETLLFNKTLKVKENSKIKGAKTFGKVKEVVK